MLAVISAGNNGDLTDTGGAPGNAVSALDRGQLGRLLPAARRPEGRRPQRGRRDHGRPDVGRLRLAGQRSHRTSRSAAPWPPSRAPTPTAASRSPRPTRPRCRARSPGWSGTTTTPPVAAARPVVRPTSGLPARSARSSPPALDVFGAGITGDATIPVFQLPKAGTDKLRPRPRPGTLKVTFDGALQATIKDINESITDTLSGFSSRGVHGSLGVVKPDVAAPGDTIASAGIGHRLRTRWSSRARRWPRRSPRASAPWCAPKHPDYSPLMRQGRGDEQRGARRVDRAATSPATPTVRHGSAPAGWTRSRAVNTDVDRLQPRGGQPGVGLVRRRTRAGGPGRRRRRRCR